MFKLLTGAAPALALALALALPAAAPAAVVTLMATGTGTFGLDQTGVVGSIGLLEGRPLAITLSYDTSAVGMGGVYSAEVFDLQLFGEGGIFGFAGQAGLDRFASIELIEDGANDRFNLIYQVAGLDGIVDYAQSLSLSLTGDLFTSTAALPLFDGPLAATGAAEFSIDDLACPLTGVCGALRRADGGFALTTISAELEETGPPGVPEPSAWALMIAGFGFAGAMLRRRRAPASCDWA